MLTRPLLLIGLAPLCALVLTSCREAKVTSYRIPKETATNRTVASANAAEVPHLHYRVPEGWTEQTGNSVRVASFSIQGSNGQKAELAVTQFEGDVGGDLANINRWRAQLQMEPIQEKQLASTMTRFKTPAGEYSAVEITSEKPLLEDKYIVTMLGAWSRQGPRTWFFKLVGPAEVVVAQRKAFREFIDSVEYATDAHGAGAVSAPATGSTPPIAAPQTAGGAAALTWTAPAEWEVKPPSQMRKGSFKLRGANGAEADFSIISFPGEAGGIVDNLNRWRGQVQLPPQNPTEIASNTTTITQGAHRFTVVDYSATSGEPRSRILGAVLPLGSETYFFKITGPHAVIEQHKAAFLEFLKTVKAP